MMTTATTVLYGLEAIAFARDNELEIQVRDSDGRYRTVSLREAMATYHAVHCTGDDLDARVVRVDVED